ncbi:transposase [Streptomyces sp. XD-27]|uniref:RNA-guided endonuclease InsQ/TnpB family protein n=1 Tax=Streptomyces sp. XD-27 TaxID=3062779 RepID=UPI0026F40CEA|nr:transposase [Streptomyces sp. XD-27]WKX72834.1 transposase [Streptomyces sp. XD-27]
MIRTYKFLMRPTVRQRQALGEMLRDHCSLYNGALQERRDAFRHVSRTTIRYGHQSAQLKEIRAFAPERQGRWSFSSQQATLRRLDKAFAAFFRRIKAGEKPGYPRFKREGKRWYAVLTAERTDPDPLPATGSAIGIDMGIANFLADSNGGFVHNPRHGRKAAAKLGQAQQALSRCKRGSRRRRKAVERVARLHRKVSRQRLDHAHKVAIDLVRQHDFIAHEDLKIRNMSKAPEPRPSGDGTYAPNGAAAKAGLNRSITDAGWGVFLAILNAKAECAGREVTAVAPRNTSRQCPECGHTARENRPTQETFCCVACGHSAHADTVGASNVLRAGLAHREAQPA